jgi:hypothetical protein
MRRDKSNETRHEGAERRGAPLAGDAQTGVGLALTKVVCAFIKTALRP